MERLNKLDQLYDYYIGLDHIDCTESDIDKLIDLIAKLFNKIESLENHTNRIY